MKYRLKQTITNSVGELSLLAIKARKNRRF